MNATPTRFGCSVFTIALLAWLSAASAQVDDVVTGDESDAEVLDPAPPFEDDVVIHPEAPANTPMAVPREKPDGTMHVHLRDGSTLIGKIGDGEELTMNSQFGEISVPARKIAVLQFAEDPKATSVIMQNGDRLTGELTLNKFKFTADWGAVQIESKFILGLVSKNMTGRYQRVQHDVVETTPDGQQHVRRVDELVEVPQNPYGQGGYPVPQPYGAPGAMPVPAPGMGGGGMGGELMPAPILALPGAA